MKQVISKLGSGKQVEKHLGVQITQIASIHARMGYDTCKVNRVEHSMAHFMHQLFNRHLRHFITYPKGCMINV